MTLRLGTVTVARGGLNAQFLHLGRLGRHMCGECLAQLRHLHHGRLSRADLRVEASDVMEAWVRWVGGDC